MTEVVTAPEKGAGGVTGTEKVPATAPATEKVDAAKPEPKYTQADLDAVTEKVRKVERKAWDDEQAETKRKADMSELEREKAERATAARERDDLKTRIEFRDNLDSVQDAVPPGSYVPRIYLKDEVTAATPEELKNPAAIAKKALDRFNADKGTPGNTTAKDGRSPGTTPRAGTPASTGSSYEAMSKEELQAFGRQTDKESREVWEKFAKPELMRRRAEPK